MQKTQKAPKKLPVEVTLIQKEVHIIGHTFMFPKGSIMFIQKRVDDPNDNTSVYQGHFSNERHGTCVEVSFDAGTGVHLSHKPPRFDENGHLIASQNAYNIKLDVASI